MASRSNLEKEVDSLRQSRRRTVVAMANKGRVFTTLASQAAGAYVSGSVTKDLKVFKIEVDALAGGFGVFRAMRGKSNELTGAMLGLGMGYVYRMGERNPMKLFK